MSARACIRKWKILSDGIACESQAKTVRERGTRRWGDKAVEDRKSGKTKWVGRARVGGKGMRKMKGKERKRGNMREGQQQIVRKSTRTRKHKCESASKRGKRQKQEHVRERGKTY